jgi:hypothetical protein
MPAATPSPEVCYWCGTKAVSRDHVPPKNLYPKGKRQNLTTVPSCDEHNHGFKKLDERMRFYVQAGSDSQIAFAEFDATTMRSLENPLQVKLTRRLFKGIQELPNGSALARIEERDHYHYFEKIARGIHYLANKLPFEGTCMSVYKQTLGGDKDHLEIFAKLGPHFSNPTLAKRGPCAHRDIFDYRYVTIDEAGTTIFAVAMRFYESIEVISLLFPQNADSLTAD